MIDYNATATKTKNVFEIIDLDISSSILASNIMGWLAAKCGSTGCRFNSINDKWTASLTTHCSDDQYWRLIGSCTTTANIVVIYN